MTDPVRSTASKALATGDARPSEVRTLAASVLASKPIQTGKSLGELRAMLARSEGREGYTERAAAIRQTIDRTERET